MMGGKKKYIEMFGSFTEPFNWQCQLHIEWLFPKSTSIWNKKWHWLATINSNVTDVSIAGWRSSNS